MPLNGERVNENQRKRILSFSCFNDTFKQVELLCTLFKMFHEININTCVGKNLHKNIFFFSSTSKIHQVPYLYPWQSAATRKLFITILYWYTDKSYECKTSYPSV